MQRRWSPIPQCDPYRRRSRHNPFNRRLSTSECSGCLSALRQRSPQARARAMEQVVEHPLLGAVRQVGVPINLSGGGARIRSAPPLLGEHSADILAELGYDHSAIEELRASGVI
mgnify:CR=1 FL=1